MFWRRGGSRFDENGKGVEAWIIRIVITAFVLLGVIFIVRLWLPRPADASIGLPDPLAAGWQGEKVCEVLQETNKLRALRCAFPPGVGHERHYHPPHVGYIIEGGTMRITDANGTREQETPAGASWASDGIEWHEALNIGETTTVYIIVEPKAATERESN